MYLKGLITISMLNPVNRGSAVFSMATYTRNNRGELQCFRQTVVDHVARVDAQVELM